MSEVVLTSKKLGFRVDAVGGLKLLLTGVRDGHLSVEQAMTCFHADSPSDETSEPQSQAAKDVLGERQRQVTVECWTPEHDDQHNDGELAEAAVAYASHAASRGWSYADAPDEYRSDWPFPREKKVFGYGCVTWPKHWSWDWWKPKDPRRDLVRAGALIIAEIERLDRCSEKAGAPQSEKIEFRDEQGRRCTKWETKE